MSKRNGYMIKCVTAIMLSAIMLSGCSKPSDALDGTKVILTTGELEQGLFHIGNTTCTKEEYMLYLINIRNSSKKVYGSEMFNLNMAGGKMDDRIKKLAMSRIAQIKMMNVLAKDYEVELTSDEDQLARDAAKAYYETLNDVEKDVLGLDLEGLYQSYREYAIAHKVYAFIIKDVNPEISDDEARSVTVEYMIFRGEEGDEETKKRAEDAYRLALVSEDFKELAVSYSDTRSMQMSFGKEEKPEIMERTAFSMANDEISPPFYCENGYYILHMVSTFDKDETADNKINILAKRKKETFNEVYETFAKDQILEFDRKAFDEISFPEGNECVTSSFFDIYDETFEGAFSS